ncbi:MAG: DegT/DnrJ/EryC1/StrS family aminotransferase [bacterium]|nr:DegT/DnrJ/EryC1/StrS family aminotransferase [bacterium]
MSSVSLYLNDKKPKPIEAHRPTLSKRELESVLDCLIQDRLGQGDITRRFERSFANAFGYKHVLAVNSLAAAYHLSYLALGVQKDAPVLMSAIAPLQALDGARYAGAAPLLVDADRGSFHPNAEVVYEKLEMLRDTTAAQSGDDNSASPAAFVMDHTFGSVSPIDATEVQNRGAKIIEDFTGLVGSDQQGEYFGKSGNLAVCGLSEYDLLTTGNGAVIVTQDPKLYKILHSLRYGAKRAEGSIAYDYGLEDFQAAMGLDQLSRLGVTLARRKKIAQKYLETLRTTRHEAYFKHAGVDGYLRFPVLINKSHDEVLRYFASLQIGVGRAIESPLHHILGLARLEYPNAERIYQKSVSIPIYPGLTANNVERIAMSLRGLI